jgi:hypothetical protein
MLDEKSQHRQLSGVISTGNLSVRTGLDSAREGKGKRETPFKLAEKNPIQSNTSMPVIDIKESKLQKDSHITDAELILLP